MGHDKIKQITGILFLTLVLVSCGKHKKPSMTYMDDMASSPAAKAQEAQYGAGGAMRTPVPGTIPRNHVPDYDLRGKNFDEGFARAHRRKNPLALNRKNLYKGQEYYNIYCIVCHGKYGDGNGTVVERGFPQPPSLQSKAMRKQWSDGQLFHIMTLGRGNMPAYDAQIGVQERWAIAYFVRAMQKARQPTDDDLRRSIKW